MELERAAKCLAELGNPSRLSAFQLLVQAGPEGLSVKQIQSHLGIPQSTLSHHIAHLVSAGLIRQTREGRVLRCQVEYRTIKDVLDFLMKDCCAGISAHRPEVA
ncbi:MAG: helix-turn-helix transcriptional regulator [Deltaproteobacteria bacterium]|nr:MAG: helix-turn-helix transcriptional regulator [Deltaproteobacteria bacterium]